MLNQAVLYYTRRRRKGLRYPASVLFRTHTFTDADADIDTAAVFNSRTGPVTFAFSLNRSGVGAGVLFTFGSAARSLSVWIDDDDIGIAAGAGSGNDGISVVVADVLTVTGKRFDFVLSVNPGSGTVELYRVGHLVGFAQAVSQSFNGAWADFVPATGTLTLTGNALDTHTVTIGSKVYTFQTVLTDVDGNVLIGATASDSLDNLIAAINLDAGAGSLYAASMTLHPTVLAVAGAGDTLVVTAKGTGGNNIVTTETLSNGSWGGGTLAGDKDGHGAVGVIADEVNTRVPAPSQIPLANVGLVGSLSVYLNQRVGA